MTTHVYSEVELRRLKGQALKDIWHGYVGKPAGLKNVTGLHSTEEILQAILTAQENPLYVSLFKARSSKQSTPVDPERKEMGKKKQVPPLPPPPQSSSCSTPRAIESTAEPKKIQMVERICVHRLTLASGSYFLDPKTNLVYRDADGKPGDRYGSWDPERKTLTPEA